MGYKKRYKKYKKRYKKYRSKYKKYKDLRNTWRDKARELESQLMQRDAGTDEWKQDYENRIRGQQEQFQQAQMALADSISERDRYRTQADAQAAQIQGFQGQIANFNAANAAREMQERVAADYGNLVGSVGSVSTNRRGENAYRQRWFRRPEALPPGYQQPMTIGDQSTNV